MGVKKGGRFAIHDIMSRSRCGDRGFEEMILFDILRQGDYGNPWTETASFERLSVYGILAYISAAGEPIYFSEDEFITMAEGIGEKMQEEIMKTRRAVSPSTETEGRICGGVAGVKSFLPLRGLGRRLQLGRGGCKASKIIEWAEHHAFYMKFSAISFCGKIKGKLGHRLHLRQSRRHLPFNYFLML